MISEPQDAERRAFHRIERRLPFEVRRDGAALSAETINLSCNGAYCKIDGEIPEMTSLRITLALPDGDGAADDPAQWLDCEGIVVRSESDPSENGASRIAIFFHQMEADQRDRIRRYIERRRPV